MTLDEMANFICGKVNQTETEDVTACKGFAKRRYEMIWNDQLWKDSICLVNKAIGGQVPIGAAIAGTSSSGQSGLTLVGWHNLDATKSYRVTLDSAEHDITGFTDYSITTDGSGTGTGDDGETFDWPPTTYTLYELGDDPILTNGQLLVPRAFERVMAVRTNERALSVVAGELLWRVDLDEFARTGTPFQFFPMAPVVWIRRPEQATDRVKIYAANSDDNTKEVSLSWIDSRGESYDATLTANSILETTSGGPLTQEILSFSKSTTSGAFTLASAADSGIVFARLGASETDFVTYRRIRLIDIPSSSTTLRILGKGRPAGFKGDNDSPRITGVTNCLLAFTHADMLERERQYAKAKEKFQEGLTLLDQLKAQETVQESRNQRIIPESGYGDENFSSQTNGLIF